MRLAIMQPYFFPYVGYFSLLEAADCFVIFDSVQYIRHGWVNRNRILKPGIPQPQYITVPVAKHPRDTRIRDVKIASHLGWQKRMIGQLQHYKNRAMFFDEAIEILNKCFSLNPKRLVDLNRMGLREICRVLEIDVQFVEYSEIADQVEAPQHPGGWAAQISKVLNASSYVNPIAGREIFHRDDFERGEIELEFLQNRLGQYPQGHSEFVPGLSVLDALMFNGSDGTRKLIDDYELIRVDASKDQIQAKERRGSRLELLRKSNLSSEIIQQ